MHAIHAFLYVANPGGNVHLTSIEMTGFKSFADKTRLTFEPGMTAIVGPNGCGKSNVSDAIRWVLGEQSAKALRGAKMEDCIFNGTQNRKPLGMAEVSITFTNCEHVLQTEYHEVTITRRVFRSGEGQYFLNKTPCRLRDIQRLFMDTGVGTSSYSFMAQGRIDQILSARPEDRRAIFEEASGITKYKADKTEALRKLAHTEANLLRLADVIREVKRQIGSLQRQAGKARRYKAFKDEMQRYDLYAARCRMREFDKAGSELERQIQEQSEAANALHETIAEREAAHQAQREALLQMERDIATAMEASIQAQSRLDRTEDQIRMNTQRIEEYHHLAERDTREIEELTRQRTLRLESVAELEKSLETVAAQREQAQAELTRTTTEFDSHRREIDSLRSRVQQLRETIVTLESRASSIHNDLMQIENQERATVIQRERLRAEKQQVAESAALYRKQLDEQQHTCEQRRQEVATAQQACKELEASRQLLQTDIATQQQMRSELQSKLAGFETRLEMLEDADEVKADFPGGTQLLLDPANPLSLEAGAIRGPLPSLLRVPEHLTRAVEVALRNALDAVVARDPATADHLLADIAAAAKGATRLIPLRPEAPPASPADLPDGMTRLMDQLEMDDPAVRGLLEPLLGQVLLVDSLETATPAIRQTFDLVTIHGHMLHRSGMREFWMNEPGATNPLRRKQALDAAMSAHQDARHKLQGCDTTLARLREDLQAREAHLGQARAELDRIRQDLAQKEGELQMVQREAKTATQRLETVTWELDELEKTGSKWDADKTRLVEQQTETRRQREAASADMQAANQSLQRLETRHSALQTQLTERRVAFSTADQRQEQIKLQHESVSQRIAEIDSALSGRQEGIHSYNNSLQQLQQQVETAREQLANMAKEVEQSAARAAELRTTRGEQAEALHTSEQDLAEQRKTWETLQNAKSTADVEFAEIRMRRQSLCDRIMADYKLGMEDILTAPEPDWEGEEPLDPETMETHVAELRTKLDGMGPVNLVAIEEYQEHEERYTFLSQQEADLQAAKTQLTEMIEKINETTSQMFKSTFEQANAYFEEMFTKLFNGGTARLVLVNEEDVLDCGIEIIARPPGKRLQNISLLSGGERTLTAVALLFAIYQIKPSPFCMLDELDAPLDESNIGRFTDILTQFLHQSQFVVITHNRRTISVANVIYGVTMPERGVSKIMSMKFRDEKGGLVTATGAETTAGQKEQGDNAADSGS